MSGYLAKSAKLMDMWWNYGLYQKNNLWVYPQITSCGIKQNGVHTLSLIQYVTIHHETSVKSSLGHFQIMFYVISRKYMS